MSLGSKHISSATDSSSSFLGSGAGYCEILPKASVRTVHLYSGGHLTNGQGSAESLVLSGTASTSIGLFSPQIAGLDRSGCERARWGCSARTSTGWVGEPYVGCHREMTTAPSCPAPTPASPALGPEYFKENAAGACLGIERPPDDTADRDSTETRRPTRQRLSF